MLLFCRVSTASLVWNSARCYVSERVFALVVRKAVSSMSFGKIPLTSSRANSYLLTTQSRQKETEVKAVPLQNKRIGRKHDLGNQFIFVCRGVAFMKILTSAFWEDKSKFNS